MENSATFNARLVSTRLDSVYRVYARGNDLYFIQLAGLSTTAQALTIHFGLVGMLIGASLKRRAKKKTEAILQRAGQVDPEELLRENKNNFKVYIPRFARRRLNRRPCLPCTANRRGAGTSPCGTARKCDSSLKIATS